jgi:hypothetical protein
MKHSCKDNTCQKEESQNFFLLLQMRQLINTNREKVENKLTSIQN